MKKLDFITAIDNYDSSLIHQVYNENKLLEEELKKFVLDSINSYQNNSVILVKNNFHKDIMLSIELMDSYRLHNSTIFASELLNSCSIRQVNSNESGKLSNFYQNSINEVSSIKYMLVYAKNLFHLKQFNKCIHVLEPYSNINYQEAWYLSNEAKLINLDGCADDKEQAMVSSFITENQIEKVGLGRKSNAFYDEVNKIIEGLLPYEDSLNPFLKFQLCTLLLKSKKGLTSHDKQFKEKIINNLIEVLNSFPLLWSGWETLNQILNKNDYIDVFSRIEQSYVKFFYLLSYLLEHYSNTQRETNHLISILLQDFPNNNFILDVKAKVTYANKNFKLAKEEFDYLFKYDPFRLKSTDVYSDLLYITNNVFEHCIFAKKCYENDKFSEESNYVVGNFFAYKCEHLKAIDYYLKCLYINPKYYKAWITLGHEYFEIKQNDLAISAYRNAIEIKNDEAQVWYAIGQIYDLYSMINYSLYYYSMALQYNPLNSKFWGTLAFCYERLDNYKEALEFYQKCLYYGDAENSALFKLASINEKLKNFDIALKYYDLVLKSEESYLKEKSIYFKSCLFIVKYYYNRNDYESAMNYIKMALSQDDLYTYDNANEFKIFEVQVASMLERNN